MTGLLVKIAPPIIFEENGGFDGGGEVLCGPIELPIGFKLSNLRIDGDLIVSSQCHLVNVSVFNGSLITRENTDKVVIEWSDFDNRRGSSVMHAGIGIKMHGCKFYGDTGFDQYGAGRTCLRHCEFFCDRGISQSLGFIHVTNTEFRVRQAGVFLMGGSLLSQHNTWIRKSKWWTRPVNTVSLVDGAKFKSQNDEYQGKWLITPVNCPDLRRPAWSVAPTLR